MVKEPWRLEKEQMVRDFHVWNQDAVKGQTVFTGSSLMEMFPIEKWAKELGPNAPIVYNRGVGGYRTTDLLPILDACVFEPIPRTVFIIYMMAYYPVNYDAATEEMKPCLLVRTNEKINKANELVAQLAAKHGQRYINVNAPLIDEQGRLKAEYTIEGMHIKPEGYRAIFDDVMAYVKE